MFTPNHQHLLVKGFLSNPPKEVEILNEWFKVLVNKVGMQVVAGPTSVYVDEPGNEGLTGTVTLATSHASLHCWDNTNPSMFQFDLYSCTCFSIGTVLDHLNEFGLVSCEYMMIDRNNGFKIVEAKTK